jgi:hypothetical protein
MADDSDELSPDDSVLFGRYSINFHATPVRRLPGKACLPAAGERD